MRFRLRAVPLAWAIGLLVIGSLVGTVLMSSSFQKVPLPRTPLVDASAAIGAANIVTPDSSIVDESYTARNSSGETIERARQQLTLLTGSSELGSTHDVSGAGLEPWLNARSLEFDAHAFIRSADLTAEIPSLPTQADTNSTMPLFVADSVVGLRSAGSAAFWSGGATVGSGGAGGGSAGFAGGSVASGDGTAGGQDPLRGPALSLEQEASNGSRDDRGPNDNAASHAEPNHTPGPSGNAHPPVETPYAALNAIELPSPTGNPVASVPEPSILLLMGLGFSGLAAVARRHRR